MAATTPICDFGWKAVDFSLTGVDGKTYTLKDIAGSRGTLVMFICNHCPYVRAIVDRLVRDAKALQDQGIGVIAIMSNDTLTYPDDSFDNMKVFSANHGFTFPYVIDETQEVAKSYGALRTPHFFVFNEKRELIYTGRALDHPRQSENSKVFNLDQALHEYVSGKSISTPLTNPIGCNVKWDGKDQHWMPEEACDLVL